jgi:hypothetical protein
MTGSTELYRGADAVVSMRPDGKVLLTRPSSGNVHQSAGSVGTRSAKRKSKRTAFRVPPRPRPFQRSAERAWGGVCEVHPSTGALHATS